VLGVVLYFAYGRRNARLAHREDVPTA
jgi:hypothetical protein